MNDLTVILVNRDLSQEQEVTVTLNHYHVSDRGPTTLQLSAPMKRPLSHTRTMPLKGAVSPI